MDCSRRHCKRHKKRAPVLPHFPHLLSRALLFFARQFARPFHRLSTNILREICCYLWFQPKLLTNELSPYVWSFNPATHYWVPECNQTEAQRTQDIIAAVYFGENEAFIQTGPCWYTESYIMQNGVLRSIPPIRCYDFGAIYDPPRMRICFFGGIFAHGRSRKCFQWIPGAEEWRIMPSMHRKKWAFSPCWFRDRIYLCFSSIEIFNPQNDSFTLIPNLTFDSDLLFPGFCFSLPDQGEIVTISEDAITRWKPGTSEVRKVFDMSLSDRLNCTPVVYGQWAYVIDDCCDDLQCMAINFRDGTKLHLSGADQEYAVTTRTPSASMLQRVLIPGNSKQYSHNQ